MTAPALARAPAFDDRPVLACAPLKPGHQHDRHNDRRDQIAAQLVEVIAATPIQNR